MKIRNQKILVYLIVVSIILGVFVVGLFLKFAEFYILREILK